MNAPRYNPPREGGELAPLHRVRPTTPRTDSLARSIPTALHDVVALSILAHAKELEMELAEALHELTKIRSCFEPAPVPAQEA
jgi:hypothetical protein